MTASAKLTLSAEEQLLVNNSVWILTKHTVIEKAIILLSGLSDKIRLVLATEKNWLPQIISQSEPKISKGENYRRLPYVILDHPRCFDKENIFAVRTMFWWGNFFSITLHLSGIYKEQFSEALIKNTGRLQKEDYYICINEDQWQHHFEPGNYFLVSKKITTEFEEIIKQQSFIKIARKFSLEQWNEMPMILENSFSKMMELIK